MNDEFCYLLRVRYSECDAQKVVFNARYADYLDVAVGEFMRAIWGDYDELLAKGIDNQVVSYSIDWQASASFDQVLAITVSQKKIGNSSYTLQVNFYNHDNKQLLASSQIVYVMVSLGDHVKMTIPDDLRKPLETGAPGIIIDHAGALN